MSQQDPTIPSATQAKGIDAVVNDIQQSLTFSLDWLSNGMGRAYRLQRVRSNGAIEFKPMVYLGTSNQDYFAAVPDNDKEGQSVILVGDSTPIIQRRGFHGRNEYPVSIIFSANLKTIDSTLLLTEDFTEHLMENVTQALIRDLVGKYYELEITSSTRQFEDVYREFDIATGKANTRKQLLPMTYFRFDCLVRFDESCPSATLNRCTAILQNLTSEDLLNCILPTYNFSTTAVQDATSVQQRSDMSDWLCTFVPPDVCTVVIPTLDFTESGTDYECLSTQQVTDIIDRNAFEYTFLDGTNESISIGTITETISSSFLSISYWFKGDSISNRHGGNYGGDTTKWLETGTFSNGQLFFAIGNGAVSLGLTPVALFNRWTHLGFVFDGTQTGNSERCKIYIDGVPQILTFPSSSIPSTTTSATFPWSIGKGVFFGNGCLSEYTIWDEPLTDGNMSQIAASDQYAPNYTGITGGVARWILDTLNPVDQTGSYNGTSVNMDATNIMKDLR